MNVDLVITHPSCPVQGAEARAVIAASRIVATVGPFTIATSALVPKGRIILVDQELIREGISLPLGRT